MKNVTKILMLMAIVTAGAFLTGCKSTSFTLQLEKTNEALVSTDGKNWTLAETGAVFEEGMSLKTLTGARTTLKMEAGGVVRVNENSELKLEKASKKEVWFEQKNGKTYHFVQMPQGSVYGVKALGHTVSTTGPVFEVSVNAEASRMNVKAIEGKVKVAAKGKESSEERVLENQETTVSTEGASLFTVVGISADYLKSPWFLWNQEQDAAMGLKRAEEPEAETEAEDEKKTDKTATGTKKTSGAATGSTKTTSGVSTCTPSLSASKKLDGVGLAWSQCGSSDFQFYKLVRSRSNPSPTYPADSTIYSSANRANTSFFDKNLPPNVTYYYRACAVHPVNIVRCGNVVSISF